MAERTVQVAGYEDETEKQTGPRGAGAEVTVLTGVWGGRCGFHACRAVVAVSAVVVMMRWWQATGK
ncbi:hypothetical protein [Escherichia coli]|uniref:hypothetical protein n=1 Tax=Escherichia coli TaxID=562 RepID=UPI0039E1B974